jgi:hypothetical protein
MDAGLASVGKSFWSATFLGQQTAWICDPAVFHPLFAYQSLVAPGPLASAKKAGDHVDRKEKIRHSLIDIVD